MEKTKAIKATWQQKCSCGSGKKYRYCHGKSEIELDKEKVTN